MAAAGKMPDEGLLEDLSARFIMNVPREEIGSFESLMFLIEQAAWFYEDFYREKDKTLRNLGLREFAQLLFNACPELYQLYGDQSSLDAQYRYVLFTAHLLFSCPVHLRQGCADVDGGPVPRTHHAACTNGRLKQKGLLTLCTSLTPLPVKTRVITRVCVTTTMTGGGVNTRYVSPATAASYSTRTIRRPYS